MLPSSIRNALLFIRSLSCGFACLALASLSLQAELPEAVKAVLERNIEASGGRERLAQVKALRMLGEFSIPAMGMKGKSTIVQAYPDKLYAAQEIPGIGRMVQAFDGDQGWSQDPMQGFRQLTEGEIATMKQNEGIGEMLDYESAYASGEMLADAEVDGEAVAVVKLVDAGVGAEQTRYYSKESGLLKKIETIADMGPMGKMPASMVIKDYLDHEGLRFPSEMEMMNAGIPIVMTFVSLEVNPEIDASLFAAP